MKAKGGKRVAKQTLPQVQRGRKLSPLWKRKAETVEGVAAVDKTIGKRLGKQGEGMKKMRKLKRKGLREEGD
eukprot:2710723-Karenia_brevis.AAC.1